MSSKIVERIAAQTGIPNLASALTEIPLSDLQSLLMHVYQTRTGVLGLPGLLRSADRPLLQASRVDARLFNLFDRVAFEAADGFEAIELAPVCPLGLNHVLGAIDQNSMLTTIRNAEVLGDATMPMALECWRRRRDSSRQGDPTPVRLVTSQRMVRMQPFDVPGYVAHFRLLSMVSAGRDTGSQAFEIQHLGEHIRFYLKLFRTLNTHGFVLNNPLVEISDTVTILALLSAHGIRPEELRQSIRAHRLGGSEQFLAERGVDLPCAIEDPASQLRGPTVEAARLARLKTDLLDGLQAEFPEARFRFNLARLEGLSYYSGLACGSLL